MVLVTQPATCSTFLVRHAWLALRGVVAEALVQHDLSVAQFASLMLLAFAVWMVWSAVVVNLTRVGFAYSADQLFWLAALPGLSGATLRIFYSFMVPIFGGRRWTAIATASLLLPAVGIGLAAQNPNTPYWLFLLLALVLHALHGLWRSWRSDGWRAAARPFSDATAITRVAVVWVALSALAAEAVLLVGRREHRKALGVGADLRAVQRGAHVVDERLRVRLGRLRAGDFLRRADALVLDR